MATLFTHYTHSREEPIGLSSTFSKEMNRGQINLLFANTSDSEEEIYSVTVDEVASTQRRDPNLKRYFKKNFKVNPKGRISLKVIDSVDVLLYDNVHLIIPTKLQNNVVQWYHHYLMHPGYDRLEGIIAASMYWKSLRTDVRMHTKKCVACQLGKKRKSQYGHLPPKIAETVPWRSICVESIGPYTIKARDKTILDFMCLTMINPATGWFEIIELPLTSITIKRANKEITEVIIDKSSASVSHLFNKRLLSRYPRAKQVIYNNGSEFKLHFKLLCK